MQTKKKIFIIVTGATASGKSAFAEELALSCNGEILNADVGQFYRPLSLGTAKPDLSSVKVPHHLFDILTEPKDYSVADYRIAARTMMEELWSQHKISILTGGSLFYLKSLFFPPRTTTTLRTSGATSPVSWEDLHAIDPERAARIHPHDAYRIERAYALWQQEGVPPSLQKPIFDPLPGRCILVHVTRERTELYERINQRVGQMFSEGWIEEVAGLSAQWHTFLEKKKLIGYPEIQRYLQEGQSADGIKKLEEAIAQATRQYAKRQLSFYRSFIKDLEAAGAFKAGIIEALECALDKHAPSAYIQKIETSIRAVV